MGGICAAGMGGGIGGICAAGMGGGICGICAASLAISPNIASSCPATSLPLN